MKIKHFIAREIQYFKLGIFSFKPHVYCLTLGFIALTYACNLPTRAFHLATRVFNLATRAFSLLTHGFELATRRFELVTHGFELLIRGFELVTCKFELTTRGNELVTRVLLFHTLSILCEESVNAFGFFKFLKSLDFLKPIPTFSLPLISN